ncbi:MAG: hypothetical protein ACK56I_24215, partial [bacterium]
MLGNQLKNKGCHGIVNKVVVDSTLDQTSHFILVPPVMPQLRTWNCLLGRHRFHPGSDEPASSCL